jgi:hypothetical protein
MKLSLLINSIYSLVDGINHFSYDLITKVTIVLATAATREPKQHRCTSPTRHVSRVSQEALRPNKLSTPTKQILFQGSNQAHIRPQNWSTMCISHTGRLYHWTSNSSKHSIRVNRFYSHRITKTSADCRIHTIAAEYKSQG